MSAASPLAAEVEAMMTAALRPAPRSSLFSSLTYLPSSAFSFNRARGQHSWYVRLLTIPALAHEARLLPPLSHSGRGWPETARPRAAFRDDVRFTHLVPLVQPLQTFTFKTAHISPRAAQVM